MIKPLLGLLFISLLSACQLNPYDESEKPSVQVGGGLTPMIQWTPQGVQAVRVYQEGSTNLEGLMWTLSAQQDNGLLSPITYGVVPPNGHSPRPARPLQAGASYTLVVQRKDLKSQDAALDNVSHQYETRQNFTARLPLPPAFGLPLMQNRSDR